MKLIEKRIKHGLHGTFGVFFVAMLDALAWSRATTAGLISLAIIFEGACLPCKNERLPTPFLVPLFTADVFYYQFTMEV